MKKKYIFLLRAKRSVSNSICISNTGFVSRCTIRFHIYVKYDRKLISVKAFRIRLV
jgi:hypothetical protein